MKIKDNKEKGITLVALVVTIIIMLILAGIALHVTLGENGLIQRAIEIKNEHIKANYAEVIELIRGRAEIEKALGELSTKEIMDNCEEEIRNNKTFNGSQITRITDEETDKIIVETKEGYIYEITEDQTRYLGEKGDTGLERPPLDTSIIQMKAKPTTPTQGPVEVTITTTKPEFNIQYSYDSNKWTTYTEEIAVNENKVIYARLVNEIGLGSGKEGVASINILNIDKVEPSGIEFSKADSTSSSIKITATATDTAKTEANACSGIKEMHFWYSDNDGTSWEGETIKKNTVGEAGTASATYTEEVEWTGLTQTKDYKVKVKAIDCADNEKEVTYEGKITTGTVPGLQESNLKFDYTPKTPTQGTVTVTLTPTIDIKDYTLEYKTNKVDWTEYPEEVGITVNENGPIYARLIDEAKQTGNKDTYATGNVENIDKVGASGIQFSKASSTSSSIKITATATDTAKTTTNACSGIKEMHFWYSDNDGTSWEGETIKKNTVGTAGTASATYTEEVEWKNLTQTKDYKIKVKAIDCANNEKEVTYEGKITTKTIPGGGTGLQGAEIEFAYSPDASQWTRERVVTIKNNAGNQYTIEYSLTGADNDWHSYPTTGVTMTANGALYARLKDSAKQTGDSATHNEMRIDTTPPVGSTAGIKTTVTESTITASLEVTDKGGSGIAKVEWSYKLKTENQWKSAGVSTYKDVNGETAGRENETATINITNLSAATQYDIKAVIYDVAGNTTEVTKTGVTTKDRAVTSVTVSPDTGEIIEGGTITLTATINPSDATNQKLTWSATPDGTVSIDESTDGKTATITGVKAGVATVIVQSQADANKKATCTITVKPPVYYADVDGDTIVDGVIYADLAIGGSGYWYNEEYGSFTIPTVSTANLKEYKITQESYTGKFGTGKVLARVNQNDKTKGDRFYVMALDYIEGNILWWHDAKR